MLFTITDNEIKLKLLCRICSHLTKRSNKQDCTCKAIAKQVKIRLQYLMVRIKLDIYVQYLGQKLVDKKENREIRIIRIRQLTMLKVVSNDKRTLLYTCTLMCSEGDIHLVAGLESNAYVPRQILKSSVIMMAILYCMDDF